MQPTNHNAYHEIRLIAALLCGALLSLHFYYYCYTALSAWHLTAPIGDRLATTLAGSGLFRHRASSKLLALAALGLTLIGHPSPGQPFRRLRIIYLFAAGIGLYLGSDLILFITGDPQTLAATYIVVTLAGLWALYSGASAAACLLYWRFSSDVFNRFNESFPQQERRIPGPYTIHLKGRYTLRNQVRDSVINLEIFRGTLIMGVAGSGKTRHVFREMIRQSLNNGMALCVYDLKYDDLTRLTYNILRQIERDRLARRSKNPLPPLPTFYSINFDDFSRSHRCNPLDPASLSDPSDAAEYARTILYALNKRWITMQGEFFVESAISFFAANIWFLREYEGGRYCTLPHLIEIIQSDFYKLFSVLRSYSAIDTLISPFSSALDNKVGEQLQGQVDSARIALAALASPNIYYLLSANDLTLDINNPAAPKVVCIGSNPQKQFVYGAVISLFVTRLLKLVNKKGCVPCHLFFDEFPSFYAHGIHLTLAQARANRVAVTLGIQDLSQLRMEYGRDHADALFNLPANLICGQVTGDSARLVSERFGKILQQRNSISSNSRDSSTSQSLQLDLAVPPSKISSLSAGEFVGITADTPARPLQLKAFHCRIPVDNAALEKEETAWQLVPEVRTVTRELVEFNFRQIKQEARQLVDARLACMQQTPELARLIVTKKVGSSDMRQSP
jgi:YWFCY protein/Type IV secretory system Conjugative DNA transfer